MLSYSMFGLEMQSGGRQDLSFVLAGPGLFRCICRGPRQLTAAVAKAIMHLSGTQAPYSGPIAD